MRLAYFWLTPKGRVLAERLCRSFGGTVEPKECFAKRVQTDFAVYDGLVFIMAAGIAVRMLAPLLKDKTSDPAVVVLDQQGRYAVSLLSGHLGGANALARQIAAELGGEAVITTATDVEGVPAFDEFAKENGLYMENLSELKYISGALAAGETVDLLTEMPVEPMPQVHQTNTPKADCCVVISHRTDIELPAAHVLYLRPKNLVIGVGCKRDIPPEHLEQCFLAFLEAYRLSVHAVAKIATISRKQDEPAILQLCHTYALPLEIVPDEMIAACDYPFAASAFVKQVTGLPSVAEACAYLASGQGEPLSGKVKYTGVTLAACRQSSGQVFKVR